MTPPFRCGVEIKRTDGQQISSGCGVREVENMLRRKQALVGVRRIAGRKNLVAKGEIRGETSGKVRTDRRACASRGVLEYRPITDVLVGRDASLEIVVGLRQAPDVVIPRIFISPARHPHSLL